MSDDGGYTVERLRTERERLMIERDLLRARLTDTERKLREAQEQTEHLESELSKMQYAYESMKRQRDAHIRAFGRIRKRCERLEGFISKQEQDFRDRHKAQSRMRKAARASGDRDAEKFHEGAQCMALQAAEQLCGATFSGTEPDEMTHEQDVFELRLCEQNHLILKPNQLYRFTVDETCEACRAIASEYAEPDEQEQPNERD